MKAYLLSLLLQVAAPVSSKPPPRTPLASSFFCNWRFLHAIFWQKRDLYSYVMRGRCHNVYGIIRSKMHSVIRSKCYTERIRCYTEAAWLPKGREREKLPSLMISMKPSRQKYVTVDVVITLPSLKGFFSKGFVFKNALLIQNVHVYTRCILLLYLLLV